MINNYENFIFESILYEIFNILESDTSYTYEWDMEKTNSTMNKLKSFLSKLSKEKIMEYLLNFISKINIFSESKRRSILVNYTAIFLIFLSADYINNRLSSDSDKSIERVKVELSEIIRKSKFEESQEHVSLVEGGYSDDKNDTGNFIELGNGLKRFIGSKFGISAPILKTHLGRLPNKEEMENLSYSTALKIYKDNYWNDQNLSEFCNQSIATTIYDACVNQGIGGTKIMLKKALRKNGIKIGVGEDPFESKWIKSANSINQENLFISFNKYRERRYRNSSSWKTHGDGWMNRLSKIEYKK